MAFQFPAPSKRALRREWTRRRKEVADTWFDGDEDRADEVLGSLPYSTIPGWQDVDHVMQTIKSAGGE